MFDSEKIWTSTQLPTLPGVAVRLIELSRNPETDINDIVNLIKTDPAICAKILKSTNSSFFGFSSPVTSINRAVPLLGTTVVTSLALSFSLAGDSIKSGPLQPFYNSYWKQSIIHAVACEIIGAKCSRGLECEFFLAGMLMDIGRLAMLKAIPRDYFPALLEAASQKRELHETEMEFLGLDHAHVSFKLIKSWNFPDAMMKGVSFQHASEEVLLNELDAKKDTMAAAMVLSNAVGDYFLSSVREQALSRVRFVAKSFFNMDEIAVDKYLESMEERIEQAGNLFSIDMSDYEDPADLMVQANQQLLELTMKSQLETQKISTQQKKTEAEKVELETQNQELQIKATRDPLTGIYNRAFFDDAVAQSIHEACDRCIPFGVIFADIDKFKLLNDTYGHQFGDEVLKKVAALIARNLRPKDVLARYGGEEFVILISTPTEKSIQKIAERIRASLEAGVFYNETTPITVTASFGAAVTLPGRIDNNYAEQVVQQADEAMYESKKNGRNQVHVRSLFSDSDRKLSKAINQGKMSRWLVNKEVMDIPSISRSLLQVTPDKRALGKMAIELDLIQPDQLEEILDNQKVSKLRFGEIAIQLGYLTQNELIQLLAWQAEPPERLIHAIAQCGYFPIEQGRLLLGEFIDTTLLKRACMFV
ncbi:MAG: HDOD domain-containing protein [Planctomycetaceae bacterium]|nr:HDOD domain-containing protein [Planctomycetaceae bacterium]